MSDAALRRLARSAGVYAEWTDANGRSRQVRVDTLRAVLHALGYPSDTSTEIAESQNHLDHQAAGLAPLITVHERQTVNVGHAKRARIRANDLEWKDIELAPLNVGGACIRAPDAIGYHQLEVDDSLHILAVAPPRCYGIQDVTPGRRLAGLAVQIYSLRGGHSQAFGDFAALGEFAVRTADLGIDALAVSPTHAGFAARADCVSPYAPSSRFFLDPLFADISLAGAQPVADNGSEELIEWPAAHRRKYAELRTAYEAFSATPHEKARFRQFCRDGGERLLHHALYEALAAHFQRQAQLNPRQWPAPFRDAKSREVLAFAEREKEVEYFLFLQWIAAESAEAAQARAKGKMAVGIIADMAVGVDPSGSHAWSAPQELLKQLTIGAPPDTFQPAGQNWGLTTFSPTALLKSGYEGFIAMLRAGMRHAGGIRIDHAMGLQRLWLLPTGASPTDGAYVRYPLQDLLRLVALESVLHRAIVIGEDLGTVPDGFQAQLRSAGVLGMRVLWFERENDRFVPPERWDTHAAALTTTHDLPTVAGWWEGRDIEWNTKLRPKMRRSAAAEWHKRANDRKGLWSALTEADCARGLEPAHTEPQSVVDGALSYVGKTPCLLAVAAAEDTAATPEQPNMPGTTDEHPNWRRRLPDRLLERPEVRARIARFAAARKR